MRQDIVGRRFTRKDADFMAITSCNASSRCTGCGSGCCRSRSTCPCQRSACTQFNLDCDWCACNHCNGCNCWNNWNGCNCWNGCNHCNNCNNCNNCACHSCGCCRRCNCSRCHRNGNCLTCGSTRDRSDDDDCDCDGDSDCHAQDSRELATVQADGCACQTPGMVYHVEHGMNWLAHWREALENGTLFQALHLPMNGGCEVTTCATEAQAIAFALWELRLYLDTHPDDCEALALFRRLEEKAEDPNYASTFAGDDGQSNVWRWASTPWPWEPPCCRRCDCQHTT